MCALCKQGICCSNHSLRKDCFYSFITGFSWTNTASKPSWYLKLILNIHVLWTLPALPFLYLSASLHFNNEKVLSLLWSVMIQVRENCEHACAFSAFILNWYSPISTSLHSLCWDRVISDWARVINKDHSFQHTWQGKKSNVWSFLSWVKMHQVLDLSQYLIEILFTFLSRIDVVVIKIKNYISQQI